MIQTIQYKIGDIHQKIKCKPITIFIGPSGSGKSRILKAFRQCFTLEGNFDKVRVTTHDNKFIETYKDGRFNFHPVPAGADGSGDFDSVRSHYPDYIFNPLLLLDSTKKTEIRQMVENRLLASLDDAVLEAASVSDTAAFRKNPKTWLEDHANNREDQIKLADLRNSQRYLLSLKEIDELMGPLKDAEEVTAKHVKDQDEAVHKAEEAYAQSTTSKKKQATYAEVIRSRDLSEKLRRDAKRYEELQLLSLKRDSVLEVMKACKVSDLSKIQKETGIDVDALHSTIAHIQEEMDKLSASSPSIDVDALYSAIANGQTPFKGIVMSDGVFLYNNIPLYECPKYVQIKGCYALVRWLFPKNNTIFIDNLEALGVPDGVAKFIKSCEGVQLFGTITVDDKSGMLANFVSQLKEFEPEYIHV